MDSQSVKTTEKTGLKGYDGVKKIKGRKRDILVDTQGFLLTAQVIEASLNGREGLIALVKEVTDSLKKLKKIWADMGYTGERMCDRVKNFGYTVEVIKRPSQWFRVPHDVDVQTYLQTQGIKCLVDLKYFLDAGLLNEPLHGWGVIVV